MIHEQEISYLRTLFFNRSSRSFPQHALELIYQKQLFRLFIPKELSGLQLSLPKALRIIEECSYVDGDFGWAVQIGAAGGFFAGFVPEETARKFFTDQKFVIAGSGFPSGTATPAEDAFRVSGQWKYCSGSHYATLFTFNCAVAGTDEIRAFALLPEQVKIMEDWQAYGMRHTLSHSVIVKDQLVKAAMSFDFLNVENYYGYKLYNFPFMAFAKSCILSSLAGCFRHLLEEMQQHISSSGINPEKRTALQELYSEIAEQDQEIRQWVLAAAEKVWNSTSLDSPPPEDEVKAFDEAMCQQVDFINREAYRVFNAMGMKATEESSQFNKVWRDLTTAAQHVILK